MTDDPQKSKSESPTKLTPASTTPRAGALTQRNRVSVPGLHARLTNPALQKSADPNTMPNRIALMLDTSGSMSGDKIQHLRDAVTSFINSCSFADTSVAIQTFGGDDSNTGRVPLTAQSPLLLMTVMGLEACGSTPMHTAMDFVLNSYSITRGVIVSDGQPDSEGSVYEAAALFKEAGLPVDCVHIGQGASGEACLRKVAELTGGQYIKFTDVAAFSKSFKYLTPAFYAMLTSGAITAEDLGAKELKNK